MIPSFFGDSRPRARFSRFIYSNGWIFWLLICLTVLVSMPDMVSGNLLPKTFWATITVGIGFLLLPPRHPRRFSITPLGIIWIGYLFWTLLSAAWALSPRVVYDRWLALLLPTFAYLIAKRTRFWKSDKFWLGFSLLTGLVALIGISQYFFPSFPFINSLPGTAVPRATMGNRNYAGMYFMLVLPFLGWIYFKTAGKTRLPVSLSFFLAVTLILIVRTRGAWLGLIVGSGFILVGIFDRKKRTAAGYDRIGFYKKKLYWIITLIISLLIINAVYTPKTKQSLIKTITHFFNDPTRWGYWKSCLGITGPIVGCGFGNFPITITPELRTGQVETLNFDVHNDYLQAYLDLGIPGLLIFILFFGYLFYLAWRGRRQSIILAAGAAVAGLLAMQFTTFLSEKISSQIWLAGVVAMINSQGKVRPVFCKTAPRWLTYSGNYAAATGLFVFAVVVGYAIRGDLTFRETQKMIIQYYDDARLVEGAGNKPSKKIIHLEQQLPDIRKSLQQRVRWLSTRILPAIYFDATMKHVNCFQFGSYAFKLKDYDTAGIFALEALFLHPTDRFSLMRLCKIALRKNQLEQAFQLLDRGIKTFDYDPYRPFFCEREASLYDYMNMPEQAAYIRDKMLKNKLSEPLNPFPEDRGTDVPVEVVFSWDGTDIATSYELYLWKTREQTPKNPLITGLTISRVKLKKPLEYDTVYIWRVKALGRYGEETSRLWFFRTETSPE